MPMTFDTYSNCSFGCLYCFSQFQRALGTGKYDYANKVAYQVNVEKVKRMFLDPDNHAGQFAPYIKQRRVMQWGGLSDEFDGNERRLGKTLELLRFFKEIDYPLCFSTKGVFWTKDERYMELVRGQKNWNFKFSIITLDEEKAKILEHGVPSPRERLDALERIANADAGGATLRLRPFVIGVSTPTYLDLIREGSSRGASALSTEFLCVETRSNVFKALLPKFNALCGFDVMAFYKAHSRSSGYLRLNRAIKEPFVMKMRDECARLGMRFYVSDAHFKELCNNGSCCGLPPNWNYSRGQFCEALQIAKRNGFVYFSDIEKDIRDILGGFQWKYASGFNTNSSESKAHFEGMTMADYMRWLWNNPQAGQSPYKLFLGVLVPVDGGKTKDEHGNLIYEYKGKK